MEIAPLQTSLPKWEQHIPWGYLLIEEKDSKEKDSKKKEFEMGLNEKKKQ